MCASTLAVLKKNVELRTFPCARAPLNVRQSLLGFVPECSSVACELSEGACGRLRPQNLTPAGTWCSWDVVW